MHPVVLVHGLVGPFTDRRVVSALRPAVVISPDMLGYGAESEADADDISIDAQVEHLRASIGSEIPDDRVHLVGHSVGGVIAASFTHRYPERVASFVSVEGNFTLADAFWSQHMAAKPVAEVAEWLQAARNDPSSWLDDAGTEPRPDLVRAADLVLGFQPASTVRAMARAVVQYTGRAEYSHMLQDVLARTTTHLVAGSRSRAEWDVPDWALAQAASITEVPDAGHMIMLEAPEAFGQLLVGLLRA